MFRTRWGYLEWSWDPKNWISQSRIIYKIKWLLINWEVTSVICNIRENFSTCKINNCESLTIFKQTSIIQLLFLSFFSHFSAKQWVDLNSDCKFEFCWVKNAWFLEQGYHFLSRHLIFPKWWLGKPYFLSRGIMSWTGASFFEQEQAQVPHFF